MYRPYRLNDGTYVSTWRVWFTVAVYLAPIVAGTAIMVAVAVNVFSRT